MSFVSAAITSNLRPRNPPVEVVAWPNVDTWSLDTVPIEYNVTGAGQGIVGCVWSGDGTRLYVSADSGTISPTWYNTPDYSTPYVPEDDTTPQTLYDATGNERTREVAWGDEGTSIIAAEFGSNRFRKYTHTGTPYKPDNGDVNTTHTEEFTPTQTLCRSIDISPDGLWLWFVSNGAGRDIYQLEMSTPWDLTTAGSETSYSPTESDMVCMKFSPDGFKYYAMGLTDTLFEYTVTTQWDITTSSYTGRSLDVKNSRTATCFDISPDATKMVVGYFSTTSTANELAYYTA